MQLTSGGVCESVVQIEYDSIHDFVQLNSFVRCFHVHFPFMSMTATDHLWRQHGSPMTDFQVYHEVLKWNPDGNVQGLRPTQGSKSAKTFKYAQRLFSERVW